MSAAAQTIQSDTGLAGAVAAPERRLESEPGYSIIKRNGGTVPFDQSKIAVALTKAFLAVEGNKAAASRRVHEIVAQLTEDVVSALIRRAKDGRVFHIEDVQDQVELALMRGEHQKVARAYVLYREEHAKRRAASKASDAAAPAIRMADGTALDEARLATVIAEACAGLEGTATDAILSETRRNLYDGISLDELSLAPILAARTLVETEPNYSFVSARLLNDKLRREALSFVFDRPEQATQAEMATRYGEYFAAYLSKGIEAELIDPELGVSISPARGGAEARTRPEVPVSRAADALRPLFPACARGALRASAGLLHARRHGAGAARDRPRGARHRVLRPALVLRGSWPRRRRCSTRARCARSSPPAS
jgi:ribonucleoside-diphosphate reductase alpha chain